MLLGKPAIKRLFDRGYITIDPFDQENLGSAQYDLSLGRHFYRENSNGQATWALSNLYNPYDKAHVQHKWRLCEPMKHEELIERTGKRLVNVGLDEELIILEPGELILGHTVEFVGGSCDFVTTMMKARSSLGRNGIEVCRCAGMGDVGYFTRWTMEIVNTSRFQPIALPVGRRVAQLLFFEVEGVGESTYERGGKYQDSRLLDDLKARWSPEQMLPKQHLDRESKRVRERDGL